MACLVSIHIKDLSLSAPVRSKLALVVIGVGLVAAGLWVSTMQTQLIQTNQCGANGCGPSAASIPSVAPGAFLIVVGLIIAVYGLSRREDVEDSSPRPRISKADS